MTSYYPPWELFRNARARYEDSDGSGTLVDYCIRENINFFKLKTWSIIERSQDLKYKVSLQCFSRY